MKAIVIVNNTCSNIRGYESAIRDSIEKAGVLPEELDDVLSLSLVEVGSELRAIIGVK